MLSSQCPSPPVELVDVQLAVQHPAHDLAAGVNCKSVISPSWPCSAISCLIGSGFRRAVGVHAGFHWPGTWIIVKSINNGT